MLRPGLNIQTPKGESKGLNPPEKLIIDDGRRPIKMVGAGAWVVKLVNLLSFCLQ